MAHANPAQVLSSNSTRDDTRAISANVTSISAPEAGGRSHQVHNDHLAHQRGARKSHKVPLRNDGFNAMGVETASQGVLRTHVHTCTITHINLLHGAPFPVAHGIRTKKEV